MNSPTATTHEGESPNQESYPPFPAPIHNGTLTPNATTINPNPITLLVGHSEARFVVHESYIHRSPILQERCCGSLFDPYEPNIIRLPSDNPDHFSQLLEALYTQELHIRPDFGNPPYNWLSSTITTTTASSTPKTTTTTTAERTTPPPHISKASVRRSQCAVTNLSQVYALAQKYEFVDVQALALRKLTYYLSPVEFPEGFLWQLAMMYEGAPGAEGIVEPFLQKALAQVKKREGAGEGIVRPLVGLGSAFGRLVWEGYYEDQ